MEYYVINSSQRKCGLNHIKMSVLKGRFLNLEGHLISQVIQAVVVPESTFLFITNTRVFWSGKWQELLINWEKRGQRKFRKIHINGGRLNTPLKGEHIGVDAFCSTQRATCRPWNCSMDLRKLSCPFERPDLEYSELLLQFIWTRQWNKQRCHRAMQAKLFVKHLF